MAISILPANLCVLSDLTADDGMRYAMQGVRLQVTEEGYIASATDGKIAARITGAFPHDPSSYPSIPALESAPNGATSALIPSGEWRKAFKGVPKGAKVRHKPQLGCIAAVIGETQSTLASTDCDSVNVNQPRNIDGRFPDLDHVIASQSARQAIATVRVDPKLLIEVLKAAAAIAGPEGVTIELRGEGDPVMLRAGTREQKIDALVMPLN